MKKKDSPSMKRRTCFSLSAIFTLIVGLALLFACESPVSESFDDENLELKKGGKWVSVDQGDLYGDLWEMEREVSGVPVQYELKYQADYQDKTVSGTIDVVNPRLNGSFELNIIKRDAAGNVVYTNPTDGSDPEPVTTLVTINPGADGFLHLADDGFSAVALYDAEGEILSEVASHVYPIEEGRLNIIRSPSTVLSNRMAEVIKNFGDGTVACVIRDYCGRLYMVRTNAAIAAGSIDKPIDSPLENLAIYSELMLYGFSRTTDNNGLRFLVESDDQYGGFNFRARLDHRWSNGPFTFPSLSDLNDQQIFVANLAAACVAAGSDKSSTLTIDEIVFLNLFMGIPQVEGNGINTPATKVTSFFPYIEQQTRKMDKTNKEQYSTYRYYIDYSNFSYNRDKFTATLVDFYSIVQSGSSYEKTLLEANISLNEILTGSSSLSDNVLAEYRYTKTANQPTTAALGFASQADDYVQALEVIHNNEEFLLWKMPTPTWANTNEIQRTSSPFNYAAEESTHSKRPAGKGDTATTVSSSSTSSSSGSGSGSGNGRRR